MLDIHLFGAWSMRQCKALGGTTARASDLKGTPTVSTAGGEAAMASSKSSTKSHESSVRSCESSLKPTAVVAISQVMPGKRGKRDFSSRATLSCFACGGKTGQAAPSLEQLTIRCRNLLSIWGNSSFARFKGRGELKLL